MLNDFLADFPLWIVLLAALSLPIYLILAGLFFGKLLTEKIDKNPRVRKKPSRLPRFLRLRFPPKFYKMPRFYFFLITCAAVFSVLTEALIKYVK